MKTLNAQEAAEFLKVSENTLKKLAHAGTIPGAKVGRAWVFTDEGLESYLRGEIQKQSSARSEQEESRHVQTAFSRMQELEAATKPKRRRRGYIPSLSMNP